MEIWTLAKVNEVRLVRTVRLLVAEKVIGHRPSAVKGDVTHPEIDLSGLAVTWLCKLQNAALVDRKFEILVRPGGVNGRLEHEIVVGPDLDDIIPQYPVVGQAAGLERNPVIFPGQVEGDIGVYLVLQECVSGGQDKPLAEFFPAHREGIIV